MKDPRYNSLDHRTLLTRFIESFVKAIRSEMSAMRNRLGPFELPLRDGSLVERIEENGAVTVQFKMMGPSDKLTLNAECVLREESAEYPVVISDIREGKVNLTCDSDIRLSSGEFKLIIYPWFLYERLITVLEALPDQKNNAIEMGLTLFGKIEPASQPVPLKRNHSMLNHSQRLAVQRCASSNLTFVWGPPGTGKTTTLARIVLETLSQGKRILVTSTTNAAVDQALKSLVDLPEVEPFMEQGQILRFGQLEGTALGTGLAEISKKIYQRDHADLEALRDRVKRYEKGIKQAENVKRKLSASNQPLQLDLFGTAEQVNVSVADLDAIFWGNHRHSFIRMTPGDQACFIQRRVERLKLLVSLARNKIRRLSEQLRHLEKTVIQNTRVILSTMTNVYISRYLADERFDVVIVEEAGMAVSPTLFYCATLARESVIMVGDPKQLPPIVQSEGPFAVKVMGRSIFEVTVPDPDNDLVVMLDTQYRMHPMIGDLVSQLYYDGKLKNDRSVEKHGGWADKDPYGGAAVVLVDTLGQTVCQTEEGGISRFNEQTAEFGFELAKVAERTGFKSVAIITPYVAQSRVYRQLIQSSVRLRDVVECSTVHRFQGGERDLVILDTVDTAPFPPGILLTGLRPGSQAENLLNVAISRARGKLVVMADVSYYHRRVPDSAITRLLDEIKKVGTTVSILDEIDGV